jgi:hypothetical protein
LNPLNIQIESSTRGRSNKRPRADSASSGSFLIDPATKNGSFSLSESNNPLKRIRKARQLPQFKVYEDQNFRADSLNSGGQNEPTPALIEPQTGKIWPHISVEIPFRPEYHSKSHSSSVTTTSQRGPRKPLGSLSSIAINGAKKAPKIPQEWLKNQSNNHTSKF